MKTAVIANAVRFAADRGYLLVATAGPTGIPHIAAAGKISHVHDEIVEVTAWFCPTTAVNLKENRNISLVAWDRKTDTGYQLIGVVDRIEELAFLDGYAPELEERTSPPQVQRKLVVLVERVLEFSRAPHGDVEA